MVTKTVNNATPTVGNNLIFSIVVKNNGPATASNVQILDLLPSGYTYVSGTATAGAYNSLTGVWTVGNLANGVSETLSITAIVNASGSYANTATVSGSETDPDPSNNTSTVTPVPGVLQANLGVIKTASTLTPTIGNNVVFTIAANNAGPNNATNVKITDLLQTGYTYVSSTVSTGIYDPVSGVWTIGTFANGSTATMTITAKVNATGPYSNTAVIAGAELDPVPGNNSSTITLNPNAAMVDLSIVKSVSAAIASIGEEFDYTIEVRNTSANLATGVVVADILPAGLSFVSSSTNYGTASYNSSTRDLNWTLGNLSAGASVTLTFKVKTDNEGVVINTATVTSKEQDVNLANNTSSVSKEIFGLRMPNVITPDGDGKNDALKILGLMAYPENSLSVFNRWGNEVFRSNGPYQENWSGEGLNEGTYYFNLRLKDKTGKWQTFVRWVTLLRN
ncbi:T9SS type B sorting domain-containing protein [Pedobacter sandarakinus]|uniref:T9SS type B sorting domain-containing protein n=1 Tax=Pedobacter sandarakinus TaxID=353156 RepID=UPI002246CFA1|nr:gliding motility-associated C-terminal domain-containing protein [Pedobacter sandarakinus]MCX2576147.1 gliding motility-associated C-terminal domain-containing protein [Pedobacter sandarakinus]